MFSRLAFLLLLALAAIPSQAQQNDMSDVHKVVDNPPVLVGGLEGLQQEIRYPAEARAAGVEGRVFVQFVVDEQGAVTDEQIVRGVSPALDAEALRVVRQAKFEPGSRRCEPVKVQFSLPIQFRLNADRSGR